jgi:uncharacterized membrane protein HdeD (DUF308 family)
MIVRLLWRTWWPFLLQGALFILFGIAAIAWPYKTLGALVGLFAVVALVTGTVSLVRAFMPPGVGTILLAVQGVIGICAGVVALLWPEMTALVLVYVIAAWILCLSALQLVAALVLRGGGLALVVSGLIGLVFGAWLAVSPGDGAVAIAWLIGASMILWGATLVVAGWHLRRVARRLEELREVARA